MLGSPAAFENGLLIAEFARMNGFRVIAPSRPGYGGTPLGVGRTPVEQAHAVAALLDTLDLDRVAVLAMSGGGPAGYAWPAIVHGTADARVPIAHAEHAHTSIAGSRLRRIDGGGHTSFLFRPDLQHEAVTRLQERGDFAAASDGSNPGSAGQ